MLFPWWKDQVSVFHIFFFLDNFVFWIRNVWQWTAVKKIEGSMLDKCWPIYTEMNPHYFRTTTAQTIYFSLCYNSVPPLQDTHERQMPWWYLSMSTIWRLESTLAVSAPSSSKTICHLCPETKTRVLLRQLCLRAIQKWMGVQGMSSWKKFLNTKTNPALLSPALSVCHLSQAWNSSL